MDQLAKALPAMLLVLTTWAAVGVLLIGIGLAVGRCIDRALKLERVRGCEANAPGRIVERLFASFWLGFSSLVLYLQCWSLLLPIRWPALAVPLSVALAGLALDRRALRVRKSSVCAAWPQLVGIGLFAVWLANHALGQCMHLDTGIYHMQAVRWASSYPVVPGLAQLHGRFGFNNATHLVAALLELGPLDGRSRHVVNGLFLLALTVPIALATRRLWVGNAGSSDWFAILLIPAVARWSSGKQMNGLATDLPVDAIAVSGAWLVSRLLASSAVKVAPDGARQTEREALTVIAMMTAGICVKLSLLPYAASMSLLAAGAGSWVNYRSVVPRLRFNIVSAIAVSALIGTWSARGIVLTGYPAYPLAIGAMPVEWRLPQQRVSAMAALIRSWAREPGSTGSRAASKGQSPSRRVERTQGTDRAWVWLSRWWQYARHQWQDFIGPLAFGLLGSIGFGLARLLGAERSSRSNVGFFLLVPAIGAIVVWFLSAPAPRFASYAFWTLGAGTMAQVVSSFAGRARRILVWLSLSCCLVLTAAALSESSLWQRPGRDDGFWPVPRPQLKKVTLSSGLEVRFARNEFCWDAPLPCTTGTPAIVAPEGPGLRLRRPGDLGAGFIYDPTTRAIDPP